MLIFLQGEQRKMSEEFMKRVRLLDDGLVVEVSALGEVVPMVGRTNWQQVEGMTEAEVEAIALADPDNLPLSKDEVERLIKIRNSQPIRLK
jgi:hypothetical protein